MTERVALGELGDLVAPGQPLPFKVLDGQGRLLLAAGQIVHDVRQLAALLERGASVERVEAQAARAAREGAAPAAPGGVPSARRATWFDRVDRQTWVLDALLRQLLQGAPVAAELGAFGDSFIELVLRHPDPALFVCIRQNDPRFALYGLTHGLHTATVVVVTASQLGWAPPRLRSVALAALTMNASIGELQASMAEQKDPPTKKQLEQIRAHPLRAAQLLRDAGVADADWLAAVEDHHERRGGLGYPRGLEAAGEAAQLVRAADVFMAKISPRAFRPPLLPQQAARQLFQEEQGGGLASALIKATGIYPPGDFVRLRNGETGIVTHRAGPATAAVVTALMRATGKPVAGNARRDTGLAEFNIAGPVPDRTGLPRVLPEQVYGLIEA